MARIERQQPDVVVRFTENTHTGFIEEVTHGLLTWNAQDQYIEIACTVRYLDENGQEKIRPYVCFLIANNGAFVNPETGDVHKQDGVNLTEAQLIEEGVDYKGEYDFYVDAAASGIPVPVLVEQAILKGYHKMKQV